MHVWTRNLKSKDSFLKNRNSVYPWINSLCIYRVCFYCMKSWELSKYIETKLQAACFYLIYGFFKKLKEVWNESPYLILCMIFKEKIFLKLYSISWANCTAWLSLLGQYDVINFEINLSFSWSPFFYMTKTLNISRTKRALKVK